MTIKGNNVIHNDSVAKHPSFLNVSLKLGNEIICEHFSSITSGIVLL